MDDVIIVAAKYLIYAMALGWAALWLFAENRRGKVEAALAAVIGLIVTLILIKIASSMYINDRPFVIHPSITPLIEHAPDNGFPSDHSAAAGLVAVLVFLRRRLVGLVFVLAAAAVAWGRVAAHVHHVLDVGVGLGIGAAAAVVGFLAMTILLGHTRLLQWGPAARLVGGGVSAQEDSRDSPAPPGQPTTPPAPPQSDPPRSGRHRQ